MKRIEKTGSILSTLRSAVGPDADVDKLVVFEAIALNARPLRKDHPLYRGAIADLSLMSGVVDEINRESRPIRIMHDGYSGDLNVGRVFHAQLVSGQEGPETRSLFFLLEGSAEVDLIDTGVVDQVSVNLLPKQVLCSSCGFDFLGAKATYDHVWSGTCDKGHVLGKNGVHAKLVGLANFVELSLVDFGGAQGARIVGPKTSVLAGQLTASGLDQHALLLTATPDLETPTVPDPATPPTTPTTQTLDLTSLVLKMAELQVKADKADALQTELTAAQTRVTELTTEVEGLRTADTQVALTAAQAATAAVQADLDKAMGFLKGLATRSLVASGQKDTPVPEGVADLVSLIESTQTKLSAVIVPGGVSLGGTPTPKPAPMAVSAFHTPRRSTSR